MGPEPFLEDLDQLPFPDWSVFPEKIFTYRPMLTKTPFFTMLGSEIIRLLLDFHDNNHINTKIRVKTLEALETISDKLKK